MPSLSVHLYHSQGSLSQHTNTLITRFWRHCVITTAAYHSFGSTDILQNQPRPINTNFPPSTMLTFYDLPLEIRLKIYGELEIPQLEPISLGKYFTAEAAYRYPPQLLQISRQISQEACMASSATSKRPWKINVIASIDAELSLPDVLPYRLAHSAHSTSTFPTKATFR